MNKGRLIGMVVLVVMLVSGVIIWQHEKEVASEDKAVTEKFNSQLQMMKQLEPSLVLPPHEKLTPEQGEPIEYRYFYAKAKSMGLPIGKRYRFRAQIGSTYLGLAEASDTIPSLEHKLSGNDAAFDDESQHEKFLLGPTYQNRTVVASMGADGNIKIHRIE